MADKVNFDDHIENYNSLLRESVGFFSADEAYFARYKVQLVKNVLRAEPRRILEYGCGIGRNIPFLKEAFPNAWIEGSDIAPASLEVARKANPGVSFLLEGAGEAQEAEPFDVIFVSGVFHHIPAPEREAATASLYRRLKPGGEVYVFEHNPYNPVTRRIVNFCPYDADAVLLKPAELRLLFSRASLDVTAQSYCLFVPPKLSALAWIESMLGWLPLGGQYWVRGTRTN